MSAGLGMTQAASANTPDANMRDEAAFVDFGDRRLAVWPADVEIQRFDKSAIIAVFPDAGDCAAWQAPERRTQRRKMVRAEGIEPTLRCRNQILSRRSAKHKL